MSGWLLDANVVSELARPISARRVQEWFVAQPRPSLHISILTVAEFEKGLANLRDDDPRRGTIEELRDSLPARFTILPVSNAIALRWGIISGTVKRFTRQSPPVVDTLLAATAIEHDLTLVTRNTRDVANTGAAMFNPWIEDPPILAAPRR